MLDTIKITEIESKIWDKIHSSTLAHSLFRRGKGKHKTSEKN